MSKRILPYATHAGLARRWGMTRARVSQLAQQPSFPKAYQIEGGPKVYRVKTADAWNARRLAKTGKHAKEGEA